LGVFGGSWPFFYRAVGCAFSRSVEILFSGFYSGESPGFRDVFSRFGRLFDGISCEDRESWVMSRTYFSDRLQKRRMCTSVKRDQQEITVWKLLRVGAAPNPTALTHRARTFAASLRSVGCVSLVTLRDDSGMSHFVSLPDVEGADVSVVQIAQAVASRAEETPAMPSLSTPYIGRLVVRSGSVAVRDPQTGVDPSELVRRIAVAMRSGAWVGVSCRSPRGNEDRRVRRWYGHRLGAQLPVHHSSDEHPLIISVWAGAETPRQIQQLLDQTEAAMPGFDVGVSVKMISGV